MCGSLSHCISYLIVPLLVLITVSVQMLLGLHTCFPLKTALEVNAEQQTIHEQCAHAELLAMYRYTLPFTI